MRFPQKICLVVWLLGAPASASGPFAKVDSVQDAPESKLNQKNEKPAAQGKNFVTVSSDGSSPKLPNNKSDNEAKEARSGFARDVIGQGRRSGARSLQELLLSGSGSIGDAHQPTARTKMMDDTLKTARSDDKAAFFDSPPSGIRGGSAVKHARSVFEKDVIFFDSPRVTRGLEQIFAFDNASPNLTAPKLSKNALEPLKKLDGVEKKPETRFERHVVSFDSSGTRSFQDFEVFAAEVSSPRLTSTLRKDKVAGVAQNANAEVRKNTISFDGSRNRNLQDVESFASDISASIISAVNNKPHGSMKGNTMDRYDSSGISNLEDFASSALEAASPSLVASKPDNEGRPKKKVDQIGKETVYGFKKDVMGFKRPATRTLQDVSRSKYPSFTREDALRRNRFDRDVRNTKTRPEKDTTALDNETKPRNLQDDSCPLDAAIPIQFSTTQLVLVRGSTTGKDDDPLPDYENGCSSDEGSPVAWYEFSTDEPLQLIITTCSASTNFDTVINVFTDSSGSCNPECLLRNDDHSIDDQICANDNFHSLTRLQTLDTLTTYYIAVSGFDDLSFGSFDLLILPLVAEEFVCPATLATPITLDPGAVISGSTVGGEMNLPEAPGCSRDLGAPVRWYSFDLASTSAVTLHTCSAQTGFDTVINLFQLESDGNCNCIDVSDDHQGEPTCANADPLHSLLLVSSLPPGTYFIAVSGYGDPEVGFCEGDFELEIVTGEAFAPTPTAPTPTAPSPTVNSCPLDSAVPLAYTLDTEVSVPGTTIGAPASLLDVGGCLEGGSPAAWYKIDIVEDGASIVATTCSDIFTFDTVITMYSPGTDLATCSATCVGQNDDHDLPTGEICSDSLHSLVSFQNLDAGTYYIAVSGFGPSDFGPFTLRLIVSQGAVLPPSPSAPSPPTPPSPTLQECPLDTATFVNYNPDATVSVTGTTVDAVPNLPNVDGCSFNIGAPAVWYKFQTTQTRTIVVTTCSANTLFDTVINMYEEVSESTCSYTCLGGSDDHGTNLEVCTSSDLHSILAFENLPPRTYYIAVSGYAEDGVFCSGQFELSIFTLPNPPGGPTSSPIDAPTSPGDCIFDNATPIVYVPGGSVTVSGQTDFAPSNLPVVPGCSQGRISPTVWFTFEAGADENILITTCSESTNFDTVITLFIDDPSGVCAADCLAENDDHGNADDPACSLGSTDSAIVLTSSPPVDKFYIAVSGFSSSEVGSFELTLTSLSPGEPTPAPAPAAPTPPAPTPPAGSCPSDTATDINYNSDETVTVTGTTVGAPSNLPDTENCSTNLGSPTVWYRFQTTELASIVVTTCSANTNFDTILNVFEENGSSCICLGSSDDHGTNLDICSSSSLHSILGFQDLPTGTYLIAVSGYADGESVASGNFELSITTMVDPPPTTPTPAPFECPLTTAVVVDFDPDGTRITGSTAGAPSNLPEFPRCSFNLGSPTVWYKITTTETADFIATTCSDNTGFDTIMNIFEEVSLANCTVDCLAGGDDHGTDLDICASNPLHTLVGVRRMPPGTYYVAVSGYAEQGGGICFGDFELFMFAIDSQEPPETLPPDACPFDLATDIVYDPAGFVVRGSTVGAPASLPDFPGCSIDLGAPTAWYRFQTTATYSIVITTCAFGTDYDTTLHVFQEISRDTCEYACLGGNDDHDSELDICADDEFHSVLGFQDLPPGTYVVAVAGFGDPGIGFCSGDFALEFITAGGPPTEPNPPPTKAPIVTVAPMQAPTLAPEAKPAEPPVSTAPVAAVDQGNVEETELSLEFEPVSGPFGGPLGVGIVELGSTTFFSVVLFGDPGGANAERALEVVLVESDVVDAEGVSKLRVLLRITATYNGEGDFEDVLKGFITDNQELYAQRLRLAEAELSEALGNDNAEYFSTIEIIRVVDGDFTTDPPVAQPSGEGPTVVTDSSANRVSGGSFLTHFIACASFGAILSGAF